jgi:hypothetical protein
MLSVQGSFLRNKQDTTFLIVTAVSIIVAALGYFLGKRWYKKYHKPHPGTPADRNNETKQG